jgi:translation initiation factor 6
MIKKASYQGNPYIGIFSFCNNKIAISGYSKKFNKILEEVLKTDVIETTIANGDLNGLYITGNDDILLVPNVIEKHEYERLKKQLLNYQIDVYLINERYNALANNIVIGKNIILINPELKHQKKQLEDIFGLEVITCKIANYKTIGSTIVIKDNGFVISYKASDEELKNIEELVKLKGKRVSVNFGSPFPRLGILNNKNGLVVGELTTGIELANIMEGLNIY